MFCYCNNLFPCYKTLDSVLQITVDLWTSLLHSQYDSLSSRSLTKESLSPQILDERRLIFLILLENVCADYTIQNSRKWRTCKRKKYGFLSFQDRLVIIQELDSAWGSYFEHQDKICSIFSYWKLLTDLSTDSQLEWIIKCPSLLFLSVFLEICLFIFSEWIEKALIREANKAEEFKAQHCIRDFSLSKSFSCRILH